MDREKLQFLDDLNQAQHDFLLSTLQNPTNHPPLYPGALQDQIIQSQMNAILLRNPPIQNERDPVALGINLLTAVYQAPQNQREELALYLRNRLHQRRQDVLPMVCLFILKHLAAAFSRIGMVFNLVSPAQMVLVETLRDQNSDVKASGGQEEVQNAVPPAPDVDPRDQDQEVEVPAGQEQNVVPPAQGIQEEDDAPPAPEENPRDQDQGIQDPAGQEQLHDEDQPAQPAQEPPGHRNPDVQAPGGHEEVQNAEDVPPAPEVNPRDQDQGIQDPANLEEVQNAGDFPPAPEVNPGDQDQGIQDPADQEQLHDEDPPAQPAQEPPGHRNSDVQAPGGWEEVQNVVPPAQGIQEEDDAPPAPEVNPADQDQEIQDLAAQQQLHNEDPPAQPAQEPPGNRNLDVQAPGGQEEVQNAVPPAQGIQEEDDAPPAPEVNPRDQDQEIQDSAGQEQNAVPPVLGEPPADENPDVEVELADDNPPPPPEHQGLPDDQKESPILSKIIKAMQDQIDRDQQVQDPAPQQQEHQYALPTPEVSPAGKNPRVQASAHEQQVPHDAPPPPQVEEEPQREQDPEVQAPALQEQNNPPAQQDRVEEDARPVLQDPPAVQNQQAPAPAGQDPPPQQEQEGGDHLQVIQNPPPPQIPKVKDPSPEGTPWIVENYPNPPDLYKELIKILNEHLKPVPEKVYPPGIPNILDLGRLPEDVAPVPEVLEEAVPEEIPEEANPAPVDKSGGFRELCIRYEYFKRNSIQQALENYMVFHNKVAEQGIADQLPELRQVLDPCRVEPFDPREPLRGHRNATEEDSDSDDDEMEDNIGLLSTNPRYQMMKSWYEQMALIEVGKMMHNDGPQVFVKPDRIYELLPIQNITDISFLGRKSLPIQHISVQHSYRRLAIMIGEYDTEDSILEYWSAEGGCLFRCRDQFKFVKGTKYQTLAANHFVWILKNQCVRLEKLSFSARTPYFRPIDPPKWPFRSFFQKIDKALGTQKIGIFVKDLILEAPKFQGKPEEGVKIFESILPHVYKADSLLLSTWDDTELLKKRSIGQEDSEIVIGQHFKPDARMNGWFAAKALYLHPDRIRVCDYDYLFDPHRECIGLKMGTAERDQILDVFNRRGAEMKVENCEVVPHKWGVRSRNEGDDMIANDTVRASINFTREPGARID